MAIKQSETLSRADFDEAVVRLRLNVSDVAKEAGIPRTYLSEFRHGDRKLRPEHLAKLRDYFESKGIEFSDPVAPELPTAPDPAAPPSAPHPRLTPVSGVRYFFALDDGVPDDVVAKCMDMMEEVDARLVALLQVKAERDESLFSDGEFTEDFKAALQEAFGLLACNYLTFRMLRGWRAFGLNPASENPENLRDVLFDTFRAPLTEVGLIAAEDNIETSEADQEEDVAA